MTASLSLVSLLALGLLLQPIPAQDGGEGGLSFTVVTVQVGATPQRVAAGDLDGDSDVDLVVTRFDGSTLSTLVLVQGPAGFTPAWTAATGGGTISDTLDLDLADLDGDGDLDLLHNAPFAITVRFNAGDATFGPAIQAGFASLVVENELADMSGDGELDVAWYVWDLIGYVGAGKGNGSGTFGFDGELPVSPPTVMSLRGTLVDVVGSAPQDLALASQQGLHLLQGVLAAGNIGFNGPPALLAAGAFLDVEGCDLDASGRLDLVASQPLSSAVVTLLGQAVGNPGPPVSHAAGLRPGPLATGDLDDDGSLDVAVGNQRGATVSVLLGDGTGGLSAPLAFPAARGPVDLEAVDIDGDLDLDLIVADAPAHRLVLLRNL